MMLRTSLKGKETAAAADLVEALEIGVKAAYKAVMKPTEGTMLTVARLSAEAAREPRRGRESAFLSSFRTINSVQ